MDLINKLNLKTTGNAVDQKSIDAIAKYIYNLGIKVLNTKETKAFRFGDSLVVAVCYFPRENNKHKLPNPHDVLFQTSFEEILTIVNDYSSKAITNSQLKYFIIGGIMAVKGDPKGLVSPELQSINIDNIFNVPNLIEINLLRYDDGDREKAVVVIDKELAIMFLKER